MDRALVLPLGFAFVAAAQWTGVALGLPVLPVAAGLLDVALLVLLARRRVKLADGPSVTGAAPAVAAVVLFLALTQYGGNRVDAAGEFLLDPLVAYDTAFHVGLTWELTSTTAPQVPGLAGVPLGYHLGTDLVRAAGSTWGGIAPYDSIARVDVTLFAVAVVLGLRALAARLGGGPVAVGFVGFTPLLGDLAWVLGPDPWATWWSDLLRGNLLVSLALANPVMPALALLLGALVALDRALSGEGRRFLIVAVAAAAAVPFFKVFLGAHLLLGLGVAFLVSPRARRHAVAVAVPCALATAALVLGQGGEPVDVTVRPLDLAATTRAHLGWEAASGLHLVGWGVVWIVLSLGVRLAGLPAAVRAVRGPGAAGAALAAIALSAWPLGLLFHVSAPEVLPGQSFVNDAAYLVEQGGPLLWVFVALAVGRRSRAIALATLAAALALPTTVQLVVRKRAEGFDPIPAERVRAMAALRAASAPGEVVLQRPAARYPPLPVVLAGRRVPYDRFTPWLTQFAPAAELQARHEQVHRFFRTRDAAEARAIARSFDARYLCLYGFDRVRFDDRGWLEPLHEEPGAACFTLR